MGLKYRLNQMFHGGNKVNAKRLYDQLEDISGFGGCTITVGDYVLDERPQVVFDLEEKRIILWDGESGGVIESSEFSPE